MCGRCANLWAHRCAKVGDLDSGGVPLCLSYQESLLGRGNCSAELLTFGKGSFGSCLGSLHLPNAQSGVHSL